MLNTLGVKKAEAQSMRPGEFNGAGANQKNNRAVSMQPGQIEGLNKKESYNNNNDDLASVNTYGVEGQLGGQNHMRNSIMKPKRESITDKKNKEVKDKSLGNRKICGGDGDGNGCLLF